MSKELKIRAWNNKDKVWAVGSEVYLRLDGKSMAEIICDKLAICRVDNNENIVIEQYTGLKDKNGKEIYEGDIVKAKIQGFWATGPNTICEGKATWNLEVVYNEIRFMDVLHILGSKNAPDRIYYLFDEELSELEVIGNIHEDPELLKESQ